MILIRNLKLKDGLRNLMKTYFLITKKKKIISNFKDSFKNAPEPCFKSVQMWLQRIFNFILKFLLKHEYRRPMSLCSSYDVRLYFRLSLLIKYAKS